MPPRTPAEMPTAPTELNVSAFSLRPVTRPSLNERWPMRLPTVEVFEASSIDEFEPGGMNRQR